MSGPDDLKGAIEGAEVVPFQPGKGRGRKSGGGGGSGSGPPGGGTGGGSGDGDHEEGRNYGYMITERGMETESVVRGQTVRTLIISREVWIEREIIPFDGGSELKREFRLAVKHGDDVTLIDVDQASFRAGTWPLSHFGSSVICACGRAGGERLAHITIWNTRRKNRGSGAPVQVVHRQTGFADFPAGPGFVTSSGAIGAEGPIAEAVPDFQGPQQQAFSLPDPPQGAARVAAVLASLRTLDLAPLSVTGPLLAAVYRAPLGPANYLLWLEARSGSGKSQLAGQAQAHFGRGFSGEHLPASCESTYAFLEALLNFANGCVVVIDDYVLGGGKRAEQVAQAMARTIRAVGNNAFRGRMNADGSTRDARPPRCVVIVTGEEPPELSSDRARTVIATLRKEQVRWELLTPAQGDARAGLLAASMAAYVQHLAADLPGFRARLERRRDELAAELVAEGHARTPRNLADLGAALELFLDFAAAAGAVTPAEARGRWAEAWDAMKGLATAQTAFQAEENVTRRFLELLKGALASGTVAIADAKRPANAPPENQAAWGWEKRIVGAADDWMHRGPIIGYTDGTNAFLLREPAHAAAQDLARRQGGALSVRADTLVRRMGEAGLLWPHDKDGHAYTKKIGGRNVSVLAMPVTALLGEAGSDPDPSGSQPEAPVPTIIATDRSSDPGNFLAGQDNSRSSQGSQNFPPLGYEPARALLADVLQAMHLRGVDDRLPGETLTADLARTLPRPWWPDGNKPLGQKTLAKLMRGAGAPPEQFGGDGNVRGYRLKAVKEAMTRVAAAILAAPAEPRREEEL